MSDQALLVTGAAGFIGYHVAQRLLSAGRAVVGVDNVNDYYDPKLKEARLDILGRYPNFTFVKFDLADRAATKLFFAQHRFSVVIHLAAQAGVRYSLQNPHAYIDANFEGFINVLEGCRYNDCKHLLFASSSSVYGANTKLPFSVQDNVDHPVSLYAASKKANELMAHAYSHLYRIPATGLRFFTVYGPWYRPDMAMFIFAKAILGGKPIKLFNNGNMQRDFTYIDDVVEAIVRLMDRPPQSNSAWPSDKPNPATSAAPWKIYNMPSRRCCRCSPGMCLQPMLISQIWPVTSGSGRRRRLNRVSDCLQNGFVSTARPKQESGRVTNMRASLIPTV
jgi:UDP-glucuronate 4-epimerase